MIHWQDANATLLAFALLRKSHVVQLPLAYRMRYRDLHRGFACSVIQVCREITFGLEELILPFHFLVDLDWLRRRPQLTQLLYQGLLR